MARVVIVGAGISGLATAAFLGGAHDVIVLEAAARPGGMLGTERIEGFTVERAANGWLDNEPAMAALVALLGASDRLLPASDKYGTRWIYADGRMHPAPLSPPALLKTDLIGPWAKLRLLGEPFVGRAPPDRDETVAQFAARRFGPRFAERLVGPMTAGVFAAGPDQLSLRAAFPRLWELEQTYGSLLRGALKLRGGGAPSGRLTTMKGGIGALVDALADHLGPRLRCGQPARALERQRGGWLVHADAEPLAADAVVLACPARAQAALLRGVDEATAENLAAIPHSPVAVVATAWPAGAWDRRPDGFGVLVAPGETMGGVLGTLFTSCIFPSHAPEGKVLLRTIVGGAIRPEAVTMDDQQLLLQCREAHRRFFGEERADPLLSRIYRHREGIPRYAPGHLARLRQLRAAQARYPGLFLAGSHLDGVGVKDCVRDGRRLAEEIAGWLD